MRTPTIAIVWYEGWVYGVATMSRLLKKYRFKYMHIYLHIYVYTHTYTYDIHIMNSTLESSLG